ncbi:DUF2336 domain-containing protein [Parvibaculum sp.]|uniref:DUF2336 domain-containing protein n=1 Tax=Parvibaculum sp. TaxID=2024848 RepID=UPI002730922B|nr:DUF2336 domain-containing protein [Parvibaculum sp.]MDP1627461.1 DUF2336 domain-containing protein [Parvibaculum sp.]MDP2148640.1 DUF2336 domain-containing protein [Parvibaculum sp.]MDP3326666.1 DUF2336 domain-containing protein [Parvibaculum sp.]
MALESYKMATDTGSRDREAALRRLADLALLPSTLISPQERSILDSLLALTVTRLDETVRLRLAERLAPQADAPRELAMALALDTVEVARPLLSEGLPLKGGDLIHVAREGGPEHRALLANRKDLPSAVADVLIEMGDTALVSRLLANKTAQLSFRAIESLARRSAAEPEFQPLLLARTELTVRLAHLMFWWGPSALRLEILSRFTVERRHIHNAMEELLDHGASGDTALDIALSVVRRPLQIDKQRLARILAGTSPERMDELTEGLGAAANVRPETIYRILNDHGGEPLSVFAKATGMNRKEFGELIVAAVDVRRGGLPTKADLERIGELFDTISTDRADMALHCWDTAIASEAQLPSGYGS